MFFRVLPLFSRRFYEPRTPAEGFMPQRLRHRSYRGGMKIGARFAQVGRHPTRRTMKGPKWGEWPGWIRSRPISRVLSGAAIHLGCTSPYTSCDLPEDCAGRTSSSYLVLLRMGFTVPRTVAGRAVRSYRTVSPLPGLRTGHRRSTLCCTFRRLTPPRGYLASCPVEPGLSSVPASGHRGCVADSERGF